MQKNLNNISIIEDNLTEFTSNYHKILSNEIPAFLEKYFSLQILARLKGVGLLCGTDWINFFKNNFFYSRFDHSVGVALIIWHFTHDKAQTIAGLLHDVSTPAFSHVADFRKGDSLTQTATEEDNKKILSSSRELLECLKIDGLSLSQVEDYHKYPIADNEVPGLSSDRLEYMFPSGAALQGNFSLTKSFSLAEIKSIYNDLTICKNELGLDELCFKTLSIAELYTERTADIALFLQHNEDITTMQFLAYVLNLAINENFLQESDFFNLSESEILQKLDLVLKNENPQNKNFCTYYKTLKNFTKIARANVPLENHFCVNLKVKKRYINPLVLCENCNASKNDATAKQKAKAMRVTELSKSAKNKIEYFLQFSDAPYGCVKLN